MSQKTIGGLTPVENPMLKHEKVFGGYVVALDSGTEEERRKAYLSIMSVRRDFTEKQWSDFVSGLDEFREDKGFVSFSKMLEDEHQKLVQGTEKFINKVEKSNNTIKKPAERQEKPTIKGGSMKDPIGLILQAFSEASAKLTECAQLIGQLAEATHGDTVTQLPDNVPVTGKTMTGTQPDETPADDGADVPDPKKKDTGKKAEKPKADSAKKKETKAETTEEVIDYVDECKKALIAVVKKKDLKAAQNILAGLGVKSVQAAPEQMLPELLEALKAGLE